MDWETTVFLDVFIYGQALFTACNSFWLIMIVVIVEVSQFSHSGVKTTDTQAGTDLQAVMKVASTFLI